MEVQEVTSSTFRVHFVCVCVRALSVITHPDLAYLNVYMYVHISAG